MMTERGGPSTEHLTAALLLGALENERDEATSEMMKQLEEQKKSMLLNQSPSSSADPLDPLTVNNPILQQADHTAELLATVNRLNQELTNEQSNCIQLRQECTQSTNILNEQIMALELQVKEITRISHEERNKIKHNLETKQRQLLDLQKLYTDASHECKQLKLDCSKQMFYKENKILHKTVLIAYVDT